MAYHVATTATAGQHVFHDVFRLIIIANMLIITTSTYILSTPQSPGESCPF